MHWIKINQFYAAPKPFKQVYIIHAYTSMGPSLFLFVTQKKDQLLYQNMFSKLKNEALKLNLNWQAFYFFSFLDLIYGMVLSIPSNFYYSVLHLGMRFSGLKFNPIKVYYYSQVRFPLMANYFQKCAVKVVFHS